MLLNTMYNFGLNGQGHLADQLGCPGEVLDRPGGQVPLEPGLAGLEQHVEAELGD